MVRCVFFHYQKKTEAPIIYADVIKSRQFLKEQITYSQKCFSSPLIKQAIVTGCHIPVAKQLNDVACDEE